MAETRTILIPVDGSDSAQHAFDFYLESVMKPDDLVVLLHVYQTPHLSILNARDPMHLPTEEWTSKIQETVKTSQKLIAHYEMLCEEKKVKNVAMRRKKVLVPKDVEVKIQLKKKTVISEGKPGEGICTAAVNEDVKMIVMGSRGLNSLRRTFMGSVSDYVIHHAHLPVTVVPPSK